MNDQKLTSAISIGTTEEVPKARTSRTTEEIGIKPSHAQLVILAGLGRGRRFPVEGQVLIGRNPAVGLWLPGDGVSRRHARVFREDDSFVVEDLGSRNGTQVNGVSITRQVLKFGDKIAVGPETILAFTSASPLEEQLLQVQKMEAVGRLAAGVAHEFNNLLAAVVTNLSYLLGENHVPPDEARTCLQEARQAALRGGELSRQMLDFCRLSPSQNETVSLSALAQEIVQLLRRSLGPGIKIEEQVAPGLHVLGDRLQLYQALMNLCLNAADAVGKKGRIVLGVASLEPGAHAAAKTPDLRPGRLVEVRVEDDGIGIDPETLSKVFEPFFTTKPTGKGTGLGLSMVQGIIEAHHGAVQLESTPHRGTTARFYLPQIDAAREASTEAPAPLASFSRTGRVLVVDDDALVARGVARVLRGWHLEVLVASDGREAIKIYEAERRSIDMVLLDMVMPGISGAETFAILKRIDPKVPVWFSSGNVDAVVGQQLVAAGARGLIQKPYEPHVLRKAVHAALLRGASPSD